MGVLYGIFVSGYPYLALEYCSDVTGGRKCHLEVRIGGQTLKSTTQHLWMSFCGIFVSGNPNQALEYFSDVTGGRNCRLEVNIGGQMEVKQ